MTQEKKPNLKGLDFSVEKYLESRKNNVNKEDEHSIEFTEEINGVTYLNDSKATRVTRTKHTLETIDVPVLLILGGNDQENDYVILSQMIRDKVKAIIYLGEESEKVLKYFLEEYILFIKSDSLKDAVQYAHQYSSEGDVVLFSPACPSDKEFDNFKSRGTEFKRLVNNLIPKNN